MKAKIKRWNNECFRDIRFEKKEINNKIKEIDLKEQSGNIKEN